MKEHQSQTIKRAARNARTLGQPELASLLEAVASGTEGVERQSVISSGEQFRWTPAVVKSLKLADALAERMERHQRERETV